MIRLIKRYGGGSRKLYDTEESRYVSLEEIAAWVRAGQELRVVDSGTGEDVTAQTLAQVIYEEHKRGASFLSTRLLHDMIRKGEQALSSGVEQLQSGVSRLMRASMHRLTPAGGASAELAQLRERLEELERSLAALERGRKDGARPAPRRAARAAGGRKR
ncbi:MAG TPA: polyhydroxyalkanoate synthesis regulator DNA-binding domain-containing protein [Gemmatimonadales bacterium]|nr:polyhydroxyalkanoate synthesis regulator DNA-binding domain-containing protein [Gemmatimonadales bacterium]